jgi:hypothetical protein
MVSIAFLIIVCCISLGYAAKRFTKAKPEQLYNG